MAFKTTTTAPPPAPGSSITEKHPDYLEATPSWHRTRCMLRGADGIRQNAEDFIPVLPEHLERPQTRHAYVQRTPVYAAAARTLDALAGAIFRRDPAIKLPRQFGARLYDIDGRGTSLIGLSQNAVREVLSIGRFGLLVDVSVDSDTAPGPLVGKPYISGYTAESITNWRHRDIGGQQVLDQVVLTEHSMIPAEFGSVPRAQYRLLELDEEDLYRIRIFRQVASGEVVEIERFHPTAWGGRRLDRIPFVFISAQDTGWEIRRAPLLDLVDANLDHVIVAADLANGMFKISAPTVVITGAEAAADTGMDFRVGGVVYLPTDATCSLLEYHGDGLGVLERTLDRSERHMAHLGARLLEQPKRAPETAETMRLKQHGETSVLASVSRTVSDVIKSVLEIMCEWDQLSGEVAFELNQDFFDSTMEPRMLAELIRSVQAGYMPVDDLYWNLKRGELLRPEITAEQYRAELETDPLMLSRRPDPLQLNAKEDDEDEDDGGEAA